jgi:Flp pilus assembly protein TadD
MTRVPVITVRSFSVPARSASTLAAVTLSLMMGACASVNPFNEASDAQAMSKVLAKSEDSKAGVAETQTELEKATAYWAKEYAKNGRELQPALAYIKNLKAGGHKERALAVLQDVSIYHGSNRELMSEYGRLALEMGQVNLAQKLLEAADDPAKPDWRIISARGTSHAKQNEFAKAIPFYERALAIAPDASSVLSNLAMAYAATGRAEEAEPLLRRAIEVDGENAKLKQNLALVMGLRGKHDEAKRVEGQDLAADNADSNADLVRKMVKADTSAPAATVQLASATTGKKGTKKAGKPDLKPGNADTGGEPDWDKLVATAISSNKK